MSNWNEVPSKTIGAFNRFKSFILANYVDAKPAAGGKEVVKRCHYCGDSRALSSRHLYMGIDKNGMICYHCFKCGVSGSINAKFFRDLNIYDIDLITEVLDANRAVYGRTGGKIKRKKQMHTAPTMLVNDTARTLKKLGYINKRLGLSLSLEDMITLKIVPNLKEYIDNNRVGYYSRHPSIMEELDLGFLGFLSCDNSNVVLRRLVPENKVNPSLRERYNIYNIYSKDIGGNNYYIIPGILRTDIPCNICMAEGPFDILGVYYHLPRLPNSIYISATGKTNYTSVIQYVLTDLGVPFFNSHVHVYSDNDVNSKDIWKLKQTLKSINMTGYIHYNVCEGEKDYGVTIDRIIDTTHVLNLQE